MLGKVEGGGMDALEGRLQVEKQRLAQDVTRLLHWAERAERDQRWRLAAHVLMGGGLLALVLGYWLSAALALMGGISFCVGMVLIAAVVTIPLPPYRDK